jgi:hypothetical protein
MAGDGILMLFKLNCLVRPPWSKPYVRGAWISAVFGGGLQMGNIAGA